MEDESKKLSVFKDEAAIRKKKESVEKTLEEATGKKNTHKVEVTENSVSTVEESTGNKMKISAFKK